MELFLLYLWTTIDNVRLAAFLCVILSFCVMFILFVMNSWQQPLFKNSFIALVISGSILVFVPSQKSATIIAAGWVILKITESETIQAAVKKFSDTGNTLTNDPAANNAGKGQQVLNLTYDLIIAKLNKEIKDTKSSDTGKEK